MQRVETLQPKDVVGNQFDVNEIKLISTFEPDHGGMANQQFLKTGDFWADSLKKPGDCSAQSIGVMSLPSNWHAGCDSKDRRTGLLRQTQNQP